LVGFDIARHFVLTEPVFFQVKYPLPAAFDPSRMLVTLVADIRSLADVQPLADVDRTVWRRVSEQQVIVFD